MSRLNKHKFVLIPPMGVGEEAAVVRLHEEVEVTYEELEEMLKKGKKYHGWRALQDVPIILDTHQPTVVNPPALERASTRKSHISDL